MSEFTAPNGAGVFVTPPGATAIRELQQSTFAVDFGLVSFTAPIDFPNGTPAGIGPNATNPGILQAEFANSPFPIGVYWNAYVPSWATKMNVQTISLVPGGAGLTDAVGVKLYNRVVFEQATVGPWVGVTLPSISFALILVPHYHFIDPTAGSTFTDWGMNPVGTPASTYGSMYQFVLERQTTVPPPKTNNPGNWNVFGVIQTFMA